MTQIILDVSEENLGSVMSVLNALKSELIENMEVHTTDKKEVLKPSKAPLKQTRYQPKQNRVMYEQEQQELKSMGKYLSPEEFKRKLRRR